MNYYSNGKLLISGEYLVLDGALALAVPTKLGQSLVVEHISDPKIIWESFDEHENAWFKNEFPIEQLDSPKSDTDNVSNRLIEILKALKHLNPSLFNIDSGYKISTHLGFPTNWGLGTSSTLINNLAQWADVDAYQLLKKTFGGSGYDIACAQNNTPITYQLLNNKPKVETVNFNPIFKEHLYFVHLNEKQNSRIGIKNYNTNKHHLDSALLQINNITKELVSCNSLEHFEALIAKHETIIAQVTKQKTAKELIFEDFNGTIKSLGAWGGDFVLATSKNDPSTYFKNKGFKTIIPYNHMVL